MSQISDCLDLLRQLVAIPSESQNEEAHARFLADYLKDELEMETQLQHVEGKSYNVTGCWHPIKGKARRKLMLGGHLDTVSPTDLWETDPYRLVQQGDQLHGLGSGDMKGGLAAQLMVLKSLKEQGGCGMQRWNLWGWQMKSATRWEPMLMCGGYRRKNSHSRRPFLLWRSPTLIILLWEPQERCC